MYSIGIDIGGTNLPVGIVDLETKKIVSRRSTPFVRGMSPQEAMDRVAQLAREQMAALSVDMSQVAFAGMGVPAVLMPDKGYVVHANNLNWYDVEITSILEEKLGCRVYLENDANAAAWAEYIAGACRGTNTSVVLTLGTGLGGGVIIDGKMLWGSFYNGGELGHMIVEAENGIPCTCGNRGWHRTLYGGDGADLLGQKGAGKRRDHGAFGRLRRRCRSDQREDGDRLRARKRSRLLRDL